MSSASPKIVYVMPRLHLPWHDYETHWRQYCMDESGGEQSPTYQKSIDVARAYVCADEDEVWADIVQKPRPQWLDMFAIRNPAGGEPQFIPERGTLLVSDDDPWLREHVDRLVAILYFMGHRQNDWAVSAETFEYFGVLAQEPASELGWYLKKNGVMALHGHRAILPQLVLGGSCFAEYDIQPGYDVNEELIRRFDADPHDRLVVACYHLFRTQFANSFTAPELQDCAAFCSCMEAAFDIQKSEDQDIGKALTKRLTDMFDDVPGLDHWVRGLYAERSIFNHGISEGAAALADGKFDALRAFRSRPANGEVLRDVCMAVMHKCLRESSRPERRVISEFGGGGEYLLRSYFTSDELWKQTVGVFCQKKSADTVLAYGDDAMRGFLDGLSDFLDVHQWRYMTELPRDETVMKVLQAIALTAVKAASIELSDKEQMVYLGTAADQADLGAIREWLETNFDWYDTVPDKSPIPLLKAVGGHVAALYSDPVQNSLAFRFPYEAQLSP